MANRHGDSETPLLDTHERDLEREPALTPRSADVCTPRPVVEDRTITVVLNATDAAVVGTTLRMLAQVNRSPDIEVAGRMKRVGDQLTSASKLDQVLGSVDSGGGS